MNIRPNWNLIASRIDESASTDKLNAFWTEQCNSWLNAIGAEYGESYRIHESENFALLSDEDDRYLRIFSEFLERTLGRILKTLDGIALEEGYGKHVAIIFTDIDQYYDYISRFFPDDGEFGMSGGMYLNEGYGHFVFPSQDITLAEPIAVHELTHACLNHLPIPLWLNEGLAVCMEDVLAGNHLYLDKRIIAKHQRYWNENTIQSFWNGESFHASDEGQELSYNLAHVLVRYLSADLAVLREFVLNAQSSDSGDSACRAAFGINLAELASSFLGEGDWHCKKRPSGEFTA